MVPNAEGSIGSTSDRIVEAQADDEREIAVCPLKGITKITGKSLMPWSLLGVSDVCNAQILYDMPKRKYYSSSVLILWSTSRV